MLSVIGILIAMVFIMLAAYWQWSALYSAIIAASIVIFTSGLNWVEAITGPYMQGISMFVGGYFGMIMLGAILAKLYASSGAAAAISQTIFKVLVKPNVVGLLCAACFTFAMTAPGTPQMPNIVPMDVLGTPPTAALIPGIIGVIVELISIFIMLTIIFNRSRSRGEHLCLWPQGCALCRFQ